MALGSTPRNHCRDWNRTLQCSYGPGLWGVQKARCGRAYSLASGFEIRFDELRGLRRNDSVAVQTKASHSGGTAMSQRL